MRIFKKSFGYRFGKKKDIPGGLWVKCNGCAQFIFKKTLQENLLVCPSCDFHFPLTAHQRIEQLLDKDTFKEHFSQMRSLDPLSFSGVKSYSQKLQEDMKKTNLKEAVLVGEGRISSIKINVAVIDSRFIMGSMGSVVGEKITRIAELSLENHLPLIIISASGGGARMYEGVLSLMQMAKTSSAVNLLKKNNIPYISVLTNPTMAGVMASFAGLGDIIIAEPKALIGFTGPRVIKQTIKQDLPKGFQTSEFSLEHGLIDMVVHRKDLKKRLAKILYYLT